MAEKKTAAKKPASKTTAKKTTAKTSSDNGMLICNTSHLAKMFGVSERQIYNQIDSGIAVKVGANKFDCVQSVANYIEQMRKDAELRNQTPEKIRSATEAVKLKHEQFKSRKTELQVLQMEGKLHYEEDVKALWDSSVVAAKSRLISVGVKVAPQLRGETDESVIKDVIDREIYDALKEIADYDASAFEKDLNADISEDEDDE